MKLLLLNIYIFLIITSCTNFKTPKIFKKFTRKKSIEYYDNGCKKYRVSFFNNKFDGPMLKWDEDCNLASEANYENGKLHGYWRDYYPDGMLMHSVKYFYGQKNGYERWYYRNGKLKSEQLYEFGIEKTLMRSWNKDGVILK
ncbi:MAG: hypothetical protein CBC84_000495 [Pelagibacteraceae bacterium TMED124]|nr:hypothetical protein [Candidatus Neomarinimicrobiota bacterium]RPG19313.1 MAG: hypothetical protein CBC84_000495 [Pelagibacteraceae bacterium TMED124]|tara:strand:- start:5572 stop:5997 length:426 start_codon:yes stop_codon:yes gene_type:complete